MKKFLYLLLVPTIISGAAYQVEEWGGVSRVLFGQTPHPLISGHTIVKSQRLKEGLLTISESNIPEQDSVAGFGRKGYELVRITTKRGYKTIENAFAVVADGRRARFVCNEFVQKFATLLRETSPETEKVPELFDNAIKESLSDVLAYQRAEAKPLERIAAILIYNGTVFNVHKSEGRTTEGFITRINMTPGCKADASPKLRYEGRPLLCWFPNDGSKR